MVRIEIGTMQVKAQDREAGHQLSRQVAQQLGRAVVLVNKVRPDVAAMRLVIRAEPSMPPAELAAQIAHAIARQLSDQTE
jgi:hypothetical protein